MGRLAPWRRLVDWVDLEDVDESGFGLPSEVELLADGGLVLRGRLPWGRSFKELQSLLSEVWALGCLGLMAIGAVGILMSRGLVPHVPSWVGDGMVGALLVVGVAGFARTMVRRHWWEIAFDLTRGELRATRPRCRVPLSLVQGILVAEDRVLDEGIPVGRSYEVYVRLPEGHDPLRVVLGRFADRDEAERFANRFRRLLPEPAR